VKLALNLSLYTLIKVKENIQSISRHSPKKGNSTAHEVRSEHHLQSNASKIKDEPVYRKYSAKMGERYYITKGSCAEYVNIPPKISLRIMLPQIIAVSLELGDTNRRPNPFQFNGNPSVC
jgi:hypothetical protein